MKRWISRDRTVKIALLLLIYGSLLILGSLGLGLGAISKAHLYTGKDLQDISQEERTTENSKRGGKN